MATKIPGATKVVLADAGHASNVHQPAAFHRAVSVSSRSSDGTRAAASPTTAADCGPSRPPPKARFPGYLGPPCQP